MLREGDARTPYVRDGCCDEDHGAELCDHEHDRGYEDYGAVFAPEFPDLRQDEGWRAPRQNCARGKTRMHAQLARAMDAVPRRKEVRNEALQLHRHGERLIEEKPARLFLQLFERLNKRRSGCAGATHIVRKPGRADPAQGCRAVQPAARDEGGRTHCVSGRR